VRAGIGLYPLANVAPALLRVVNLHFDGDEPRHAA
jgi:hypothetical protein